MLRILPRRRSPEDEDEESQQEQRPKQSSLLVCSPVVDLIHYENNTTPSPGHAPHLTTATFVPPLRIRMRGGVTASPAGDNVRLSTMTHAPQLRLRPFTSPGGGHVGSHPSPKLGMRIRPVTLLKKSSLPSPLARRGAAERAYLQGQLRAETLRRRKQEEHNAQRKLRENVSTTSYLDGQIETMIEKFKVGFVDLGIETQDDHPPPQRKGAQHPYNASPPTILTRSFKRSVSAVLDDSDIPADETLLFFPSGTPLLGHNKHAVSADIRSASEESSTTADDNFWQLGTGGNDDSEIAMSNNRTSKKFITLRPKTNAPCDVTSTPIHSGNREDVTSTPNDSGMTKDDCLSFFPSGLPLLNVVDEIETNDYDETACQLLGDVINGSDSFRLMHPSEKETVGGDTFPYIFTSPESLQQMTLSAHDNLPKYSIPESNYSTPDKWAHRLCRTQFWERMPKLPELGGINDVIDDSMQPRRGTRSNDDESQTEGSNLVTPDDIQRGRKQVGWIRLPKIMPTNTDQTTQDVLKDTIAESTSSTPNIHTPRKHPNWSRAQSTEIATPSPSRHHYFHPASLTHRSDANFHEGTSDEAACEEKEKPCIMTDGRLPLSQCIYSTPDNSYIDQSSRSCRSEQIPRFPQLDLPIMNLNDDCNTPL